jgi:molybdopterin-guanine dinucleotide biosynthesis protein MobB
MSRIIQFIGESNSGKTRLIESLVKTSQEKGLSVGVIKSASHIDLNPNGKDTTRFIDTGIYKTAINSPKQSAFFINQKAGLKETVMEYFHDCEIVLVEGFKNERTFSKIKVIIDTSQIQNQDNDTIVAYFYDGKLDEVKTELPVFSTQTMTELWKFVSQFPLHGITLKVNDKPLSLNNFVHSYIQNNIIAMVKSLHLKKETKNQIHILYENSSSEIKIKLIINEKPIPMKAFVKELLASTLTGMVQPLKLPDDNIEKIEVII